MNLVLFSIYLSILYNKYLQINKNMYFMKTKTLKTKLSASMLLLLFALPLQAQVTIGSGEEPNKGALLDLKERNVTDDAANAEKGLLLSRVELENKNKLYPMLAPGYDSAEDQKHAGLIVYNTTDDADFDQGLYLWDGTQWLPVNSAGGSSFTLAAQNGLTYANDIIKLGGPLTEATTLTTTAANTLNINGPGLTTISTPTTIGGDLTISGGAPGVGKVLTSDATGRATWKNPTSQGYTQIINSYTGSEIKVTLPANRLSLLQVKFYYNVTTTTGITNSNIPTSNMGIAMWTISTAKQSTGTPGSSFGTTDANDVCLEFLFGHDGTIAGTDHEVTLQLNFAGTAPYCSVVMTPL
jgi:hypothetical protein